MKYKTKKIILIIVCVILSLIILLGSAFFLLKHFGKKSLHKDDTNITNDSVTVEDDNLVTYNAAKYKLNENIVNILIMGIDKSDIDINGNYGGNGQADCIFLAAIDTEKKTFKVIPISRESMVDVDIYTTSGNLSKTDFTQLCLAYSYGNSPESSCENVVKSVKRMFYGLNINSYVALDLNGLYKLSSLVGGVPVKALETISTESVYLEEGIEYNLSGKQAEKYIRYRDSDIDANNRRMLRQKQFLTSLVSKTGNIVVNDFSMLTSIYSTMTPYTSTNVDLSQLTYLASSCLTPDMGSKIEYLSIKGTMTESDHAEFNIDDDELLKLIIDTFYVKVK